MIKKINPLWYPIVAGIVLRIWLLFESKNNLGYYGGDAIRYLTQAHTWLQGQAPFNALYPIGYSAYLALFIKIFDSVFASAFFCIFIFLFFTFWFCKKLSLLHGEKVGVLSAWFLALNPVWLCFTIVIGADFLGSVVFGIVMLQFFEAIRKKYPWSPFILFAFGLFIAATIKPVYLYVPLIFLIIFFKDFRRFMPHIVVFLITWVICVGFYVHAKHNQTNSYAFSGHGADIFGQYIVGTTLVARGEAPELYSGINTSIATFNERHNANPQYEWPEYIKETVSQNPKIFVKLLITSATKSLFGHANVTLARFFTGKDIDGPGLWIGVSRQSGLFERIRSISLWWFLGALISMGFMFALLFFAAQGALNLWKQEMKSEALTHIMMVGYFLFTPIVFGEPRYFLPGTLVFLHLASYYKPLPRLSLTPD